MLIKKQDDTCMAGPLDIICIMKLPSGTYHVAFLEESPFPGEVLAPKDTPFVRLKSKMHHTVGAQTFEGALVHLRDTRKKIELPDANVIEDAAIEVDDPVSVWTVSNWLTNGRRLKDCIAERLRLEVTVTG